MGKHALIWLMIMFFTPLALPALLSPAAMSGIISSDYQAAIVVFGGKDAINSGLIARYQKNLSAVAAFVNGFRDTYDDSNTYRHSGDHIGEAIADIPGDWAASVKLEAYSLALRIVILSKFGMWLLIPLVTGGIAGVYGRKLKSETFSPPIPPVFNTSAHLMMALIGVVILWLLCPIPLPVRMIPMIAMALSFFFSLALAHYPNY